MIPRFARNGLLPPGEHGCEWPEFAARFEGTADNGRRRKLLWGLAQMLWLLAQAGCRVCYVDGSFVTRERWPRDFDLCYEAVGIDTAKLDAIFLDFRAGRAAQKRRFGGEALPVEFPFDWSGHSVRERVSVGSPDGRGQGHHSFASGRNRPPIGGRHRGTPARQYKASECGAVWEWQRGMIKECENDERKRPQQKRPQRKRPK